MLPSSKWPSPLFSENPPGLIQSLSTNSAVKSALLCLNFSYKVDLIFLANPATVPYSFRISISRPMTSLEQRKGWKRTHPFLPCHYNYNLREEPWAKGVWKGMIQHFYHYVKGHSSLDTAPAVTYITHCGIPVPPALGNKGQLQDTKPTPGPTWQVVPGNQVNSLYNEADAPTPLHLATEQRRGERR